MTTCGEFLVKQLQAWGVDTVFGIPGVHTVELYRGLPGSGIRHITPRHEQGAGFMADGYARVSGKPGVCFIITGPGMTNILTAMGQAYADSIPMLVISSVNRRDTLGRGQGHPDTTQDHLGRLKSHPRATQDHLGRPKSHPRAAKRAPRGPQKARNHAKTMQKPRFLQGFVKTRFRRPRAAQDAPKEAQEAARTAPERPGAAQGRAKRGPRAAKGDPKGRPGSPRTGQGAAQEQPGRGPGGQEPPGASKWPSGGPTEAQKRPRGGPAYDTRGHKSREAKARRYKWRQDNRRQDQRQDETTN